MLISKKIKEAGCKPDLVPAVTQATTIHLAAPLPTRSSAAYPETSGEQPLIVVSLFGLAPGGACRADDVATIAVSSYLTISPLLPVVKPVSGIFSVALSLGSPPLSVRERLALWRPDFPPAKLAPADGRPPASL
ncbi:hypothetical protein MNBD_NITROSPINAE04-1504 [hydrothermal vent metagenome]|uniref:Uncharacterized protein n=1 Tax=hydrothermal vent metagenome TaxID=652676 RepID=A0A3B1CX47_9ZZZZ